MADTDLLDEIVTHDSDCDYVAIVDLGKGVTLHKLVSPTQENPGREIADDFIKDLIDGMCKIFKYGHKEFTDIEHNQTYKWMWVSLGHKEIHAIFISSNPHESAPFAQTINTYTPRLAAHYVREVKEIDGTLQPKKRGG